MNTTDLTKKSSSPVLVQLAPYRQNNRSRQANMIDLRKVVNTAMDELHKAIENPTTPHPPNLSLCRHWFGQISFLLEVIETLDNQRAAISR